MQVRDYQVIRLVERIGEHYRANIANRFIRPVLLQLPLEKQAWDNIEILTEKLEQFRHQGFDLIELYQQVTALAHFVSLTRREIVPGLRNRINNIGSISSGSDRVLRDMAVNNFSSNLQLFAEMVDELYHTLIELDAKNTKGRRPLYLQVPELQGVSGLLAEG
ncbi:hypothetical protein AGMMS49546_01060 [Spirochaetia bacterium]|nr:hypothetical protein AGMMS49546_01060 [Spirochaetia bacterium]